MDLVTYAEPIFQQIEQEYGSFLRSLGLTARSFIPISSSTDANIAAPSSAMAWFTGATLLGVIEDLENAPSAHEQPLRLPIQAVCRPENRRILVGRIQSRPLRAGDDLL